MTYPLIDPSEDLDYTFDYGPFVDDGGSPSDTILTSKWVITPQSGSPQTPDLHSAAKTADTTTIFVKNATVGEIYRLTNTVTTNDGRTAQRSLTIRCEQR